MKPCALLKLNFLTSAYNKCIALHRKSSFSKAQGLHETGPMSLSKSNCALRPLLIGPDPVHCRCRCCHKYPQFVQVKATLNHCDPCRTYTNSCTQRTSTVDYPPPPPPLLTPPPPPPPLPLHRVGGGAGGGGGGGVGAGGQHTKFHHPALLPA